MLKIWINKCFEEELSEEYHDAVIFNILEENRDSNVKTDIEKLWRGFGIQKIADNHEDFMIFAMSIFSIDKRISRAHHDFKDAWTRDISVSIPVINYDDWERNKIRLEEMMNFLSGDKWCFNFRKTKYKYRQSKSIRKKRIADPNVFDVVSLFSGGLDSYCGALKLLEQNHSTCFVGFKEYNLLRSRQIELFNKMDSYYSEIQKSILLFNVRPYRPLLNDGTRLKIKAENSSRSRSLLFIAGALVVASLTNSTEVHIPENGFIGINVPLSDSRQGSCSTRTTHPFFVNTLNSLLIDLGISVRIENFYSSMTKGEIVEEFKEHQLFIDDAGRTISCSHPCQSRYDKVPAPTNCGYCYPCIIRKASLNITGEDKTYYNPYYDLDGAFLNKYSDFNSKASDFRAILNSIRTYNDIKDNDYSVHHALLKHGKLTSAELENYKRVYTTSMQELLSLILDCESKEELLDYLGIDESRV